MGSDPVRNENTLSCVIRVVDTQSLFVPFEQTPETLPRSDKLVCRSECGRAMPECRPYFRHAMCLVTDQRALAWGDMLYLNII